MATNIALSYGNDDVFFEGNSGFKPYHITVTRAGDTSGTSTVEWGVRLNGWGDWVTASDFQGGVVPTGTLNFAAGETSKIITVNVVSDTMAELDESFGVYLQNATGATITQSFHGAEIENDDDAVGASIGTAQALGVGGSSGTTDDNIGAAGDQDWYSVNLVAGTTYSFEMYGSDGAQDTLFSFLKLLDSSGNLITSDTDSSGGYYAHIVYTASTSGSFFLAAQDKTATGIGKYEVLANVIGQDDFVGGLTTTGTVSLNESDRWGVIETPGDQDWFRIYLTAGQDFFFGNGVVDTLVTSLRLLDASGNQLAFTISTGSVEGEINYLVTSSGTYYLAIQGISGTGEYALWAELNNIIVGANVFAITARSSPVQEGNSGVTPYVFEVSRDGLSSAAASVNWTLTGSGANAANATDFAGGVLPSGTVSFAAGEATKLITVNIASDTTSETDETFTITLSSPSTGSLATGYDKAIGVIRNEDGSATALADTLTGTAGDDFINGRGGNDSISGLAGNDTLIGAAGNDTLRGGTGNDNYLVDVVSDLIVENAAEGTDQVNVLFAAAGTFVLATNVENAMIGNATLGVNLTGNTRNNSLLGNAAANSLTGSDGNDTLDGNAGNDTLLGGAGRDVLIGGAGNDRIDGGVILDRIDYSDNNTVSYAFSTAAVNVNLSGITGTGATGTGTASDGLGGTDTLANIFYVQGSANSDTLTGSSALTFEVFEGGKGNDTINGGLITDTLNGDNGNRATYQNASGAVTVTLTLNPNGTVTGKSTGADGIDSLSNINNVRGSSFNDALTGSNRTDMIEQFEGRAGKDTINGAGGLDAARYDNALAAVNVDLLAGTASDGYGTTDTLISIEGVRGSDNPDILKGSNVDNFFQGRGGNDTIDGRSGYDRADYTLATAGVIVTLGGAANGTATGDISVGTDTLISIEGVRGSSYADTLTGSNDAGIFEKFEGREGNDSIDGRGGIDTVDYFNARAAVEVNLGLGTAIKDGFGNSDTLNNIENVRGSRDFNDKITGNAAGNQLEGLGGNDILDGGTGIDTMTGGDGSDIYYVRDAGDVVSETNATASTGGTDTVYSYLAAYSLVDTDGAGSFGTNVENGRILATGIANLTGNTLNNLLYAGAGNNILNGSTGTDTVSYVYGLSGVTGVTVSLAVATAQATGGSGADTLLSIENLTGSNYNDRLTGNAGANSLSGLAGIDILDGGSGIDTMTGGDGSDIYYVRDLGDLVSETNAVAATGGTDTVYSYLAAYSLVDTDGAGSYGANVENGRILVTGTANLTGNTLNNLLYAGAGNNILNGSTGTDTVSYAYGLSGTTGVTVSLALATAQATGGSGTDTLLSIENLTGSNYNDRLTGNAGANSLNGGSGNDTLTGGAGKDQLTGGTGNDTFDFNALAEMGTGIATWDVVTDFVHGQDRIDLATLDANTAIAGDQAFSAPVVGGAFSGAFAINTPAALYFDKVAHVLYGNTDADTAAEFAIQLTGLSTLAASDLFL